MWREDVPTADGQLVRRQRKVRLGTVGEMPTRSAALAMLSELMSITPVVELSFGELVERWKEAVVPTIKGTTATYYLKTLRAHVGPAFGVMSIRNISRYDVEAFLAGKASAYCRNTLRGMRVSLGVVLSWAVSCGWLDKNPCAGVKLPRAGKKIIRTVLRPEQIASIAARLDEPYSTLVLFLAVTGVRIGEAIAIKWSDFDGDVLHVCRRIYEGREDTPKTAKSERSVPIPAALLVRMRALGNREWVFCARNGMPLNPGNMLKRYVRPVARELAIPIGGWHDFRHTMATTLRKRGWSPKVISEIIGHSSIHITEQIYDHADREDFRAAIGELAGELLPSVTKCTKSAAIN
jgi:integrase